MNISNVTDLMVDAARMNMSKVTDLMVDAARMNISNVTDLMVDAARMNMSNMTDLMGEMTEVLEPLVTTPRLWFPGEQNLRTWRYYWAQILFCIGAVAVIGNAMVIITVLYSRNLRSNPNNLFIVNLAAADLLSGGFVIPIMADWTVQLQWLHGDWLCRFTLWAECLLSGVSNQALAAMSISKLIYVGFPLHFDRWMNKYMIATMISASWVFPAAFSAPVWLALDPRSVLLYSTEVCYVILTKYYYSFGAAVLSFIPFLIVICSGGKILAIASAHRRKIHALGNNTVTPGVSWKQKYRSYLLVVLAYFIFQGPYYVTLCVQAFCGGCVPDDWFYDYIAFPFWTGVMVNPFIYFFAEKYYRKTFLKMVTWGKYGKDEASTTN